MHRHRNPFDTSVSGVDMVAAIDSLQLPAGAVQQTAKALAGNLLHTAISNTFVPLPSLDFDTFTERQPSTAS